MLSISFLFTFLLIIYGEPTLQTSIYFYCFKKKRGENKKGRKEVNEEIIINATNCQCLQFPLKSQEKSLVKRKKKEKKKKKKGKEKNEQQKKEKKKREKVAEWSDGFYMSFIVQPQLSHSFSITVNGV